jgi:hypothetical protein
MTRLSLSSTPRREGEILLFLFPSGFDFGVAFALPTKARLFNRSVGPSGPTSHVFDPAVRDHD